MLGIAIGILIGFVIGISVTAILWWCYLLVVREDALDPLADIKIQQERLSANERDAYIGQLGRKHLPTDGGGIAIGISIEWGRHVYGYETTPEGSGPPDAETIFELASVGKAFTSLVLADMVVNGEIALDNLIEKYLPERVSTRRWPVPDHSCRPLTRCWCISRLIGRPVARFARRCNWPYKNGVRRIARKRRLGWGGLSI